VLGGPDPQGELSSFARDYLLFFGAEIARALAATVTVSTPERLRQVVEEADAAGCDELILVAGSPDPACLEATVAALAG